MSFLCCVHSDSLARMDSWGRCRVQKIVVGKVRAGRGDMIRGRGWWRARNKWVAEGRCRDQLSETPSPIIFSAPVMRSKGRMQRYEPRRDESKTAGLGEDAERCPPT